MSVSSLQLVRHFETRTAEAIAVIQHMTQLLDRVKEGVERIATERQQALTALARAYLPTLDKGALQNAEKLTGFRGFSRRDPLDAMAHQLAVLKKTAARIKAEERYIRREFLVGPHGELTREIEERRSLLEPWARECGRFESVEGFQELIESQYDTPEYAESIFSARYWRLWRAGDSICEALGMGDFGDEVLPAYQKVAAERLKWMRQVDEVEQRIEAIHALVQQHDEALARQPGLPDEILASCWEALAEHMTHADMALLEQWLGEEPDRARLIALRRAAGLGAKADFLEDLVAGLDAQITGLRARLGKYQRKSQKFSRGKYVGQGFPETYLDQKFGEKSKKMRTNAEKTQVLVDRMLRYDRYDRFDLSNDPELWWIEFTGKRPTRYSPRVRSWYDRNPDRRPTLDIDEEHARAVAEAAAAQADGDDLGYIS